MGGMMGGGGGGGDAPFDMLGGQYANFSGGTPGFNWSGALQGLGTGLKGIDEYGSVKSADPKFNPGQANIPGGDANAYYVGTPSGTSIPGGGQSLDLEAILRLLKGLG